jgi:hypothetical protein
MNANNLPDVYLGCDLEITDQKISLNALTYGDPTEAVAVSLTQISTQGCLFKMVLEEGQESITLPSIDELASSFDFVRDIYLDPEQTHLLSLDPNEANQPYHQVDDNGHSVFVNATGDKIEYDSIDSNGEPEYTDPAYTYALDDDGNEVLVDGSEEEVGTKTYTYLTAEGEPAKTFGEWVNSHLFPPFDSMLDTILEAQVTINQLSLGMPPTHYERPGYREITNTDALYDTHNLFMLYSYRALRAKSALEASDAITLSSQLWRDSFEDDAKARLFVDALLGSGLYTASGATLKAAAEAGTGNAIIDAIVASMQHFKSSLNSKEDTKKEKLAKVVAYSVAIEEYRDEAEPDTDEIDGLLEAKRQLTADYDNSVLPLYKPVYALDEGQSTDAKEFTDEAIFDFEFKRTGDEYPPESYNYDVGISIGWPEDEDQSDNDFPFSLKAINFRVKQENHNYSFTTDETRLTASSS